MLKRILKEEAIGGIILMFAAVVALVLANSDGRELYHTIFNTPFFHCNLITCINDGLMVFFFLLVGLEIKREILVGQLSHPKELMLPVLAAFGGMVVPMLIYSFFNGSDPQAMRGWAIPAATDIAFTLGVLSLLGRRVPTSLKLFLMTLAILDDLGAVLIIALFYTNELSMLALAFAGLLMFILFVLNQRQVLALWPYCLVGILLWLCTLYSGIHPTVAGVLLATMIPLKSQPEVSPLHRLIGYLHPWVVLGILPLFALANSGVFLQDMPSSVLLTPVALGITLGLLLGKPVGVMLFAWAAVRLKWAHRPHGVDWSMLLGGSILCGIGFTMSLFIAALAFTDVHPIAPGADKLAIMVGSLVAGLIGWVYLFVLIRLKGIRRDS